MTEQFTTATTKNSLRIAIRQYEDYQEQRKALGNRLKIKSNGEPQKLPDEQVENWAITAKDQQVFAAQYKMLIKMEGEIRKHLNGILKEFDLWSEYLKGIRGVSVISASYILGFYNINEATTVSKLWQYTGLNPGKVRGKKRMSLKEAQKSGLPIVREIQDDNGGSAIVQTEDLIPGDKLTPGYVAPFNRNMRVAMVGKLAPSLIKAMGHYKLNYYDTYKLRLEQEEGWKNESKGHRANAATRYMMKMFLKDLYVAWRELEGLPVRKPYQEEYLEHTHAA